MASLYAVTRAISLFLAPLVSMLTDKLAGVPVILTFPLPSVVRLALVDNRLSVTPGMASDTVLFELTISTPSTWSAAFVADCREVAKSKTAGTSESNLKALALPVAPVTVIL